MMFHSVSAFPNVSSVFWTYARASGGILICWNSMLWQNWMISLVIIQCHSARQGFQKWSWMGSYFSLRAV